MRAPKDLIRNTAYTAPDIDIGLVFTPFVTEMLIEHARDTRGDPGLEVHPVRDGGDRYVLHGTPGPDAVPHGAGDLAMAGSDSSTWIIAAHREGGQVEVRTGFGKCAKLKEP